jgi:Fe-S-cluster containining protein
MDVPAWLATFEAALDDTDAVVPCGDCTACCQSAQFVHIGADERDTLARIPPALLVRAPRRPDEFVLGYDGEGRCPMLGEAGCTIYDHRPRTCRTYDCRVFAVTGVEPDQPLVAARVRTWQIQVVEELRAEAAASEGPPIARAVGAVRRFGARSRTSR